MRGVLRLAVVHSRDTNDFAVQIYVNDVEMTGMGAGLGMQPETILVPENKLIAGTEPSVVPVARCDCGELGCGATWARIARSGDMVRWDWGVMVPMDHSVVFDAVQYDPEVARAGADRSREAPGLAAWQLIEQRVDRKALLAHQIVLLWGGSDYRNPERFQIALRNGPWYDILIDTDWAGRSPAELASDICALVARPPREWPATWNGRGSLKGFPPKFAGPGWVESPGP